MDVIRLTDPRDVREIDFRNKVKDVCPMRTTRPKRDKNAGLGWQVQMIWSIKKCCAQSRFQH